MLFKVCITNSPLAQTHPHLNARRFPKQEVIWTLYGTCKSNCAYETHLYDSEFVKVVKH